MKEDYKVDPRNIHIDQRKKDTRREAWDRDVMPADWKKSEPKGNKKISNAEMFNIIGDEIEKFRDKKFKKNEFFFDYLKTETRPGRKMGHLTILKD